MSEENTLLTRSLVHEQRRRAVAALSLLFCCALFTVHVWRLPDGNGMNLARHAFWHLFVITWVSLLFFRSRTVSFTDLVSYWFVGFYPVFGIAILLTKPLKSWLGTNAVIDAFWIPLVEEAMKLAALLLLLWAARRRADYQLAPSDLALLGLAIGAGFSFHEDALWVRVTSDGPGVSGLRLLLPTITDRAGGFLGSATYAGGHAVWGGLTGLGLGLWWLLRKRRAALILAVAPFGLVALDHMRVNARGWGGDVLDPLLLRGRLVPVLLLAGFTLTLLLEFLIRNWGNRRDNLFPHLRLRDLWSGTAREAGGRAKIDHLAAAFAYHRRRNSFHFQMWRTRGAERATGDGSLLISLAALGRRGGVDEKSGLAD